MTTNPHSLMSSIERLLTEAREVLALREIMARLDGHPVKPEQISRALAALRSGDRVVNMGNGGWASGALPPEERSAAYFAFIERRRATREAEIARANGEGTTRLNGAIKYAVEAAKRPIPESDVVAAVQASIDASVAAIEFALDRLRRDRKLVEVLGFWMTNDGTSENWRKIRALADIETERR